MKLFFDLNHKLRERNWCWNILCSCKQQQKWPYCLYEKLEPNFKYCKSTLLSKRGKYKTSPVPIQLFAVRLFETSQVDVEPRNIALITVQFCWITGICKAGHLKERAVQRKELQVSAQGYWKPSRKNWVPLLSTVPLFLKCYSFSCPTPVPSGLKTIKERADWNPISICRDLPCTKDPMCPSIFLFVKTKTTTKNCFNLLLFFPKFKILIQAVTH